MECDERSIKPNVVLRISEKRDCSDVLNLGEMTVDISQAMVECSLIDESGSG